ncbi:DUF1572 domain-containing protein [Terrimonas sp. NA20]|uniref:DUF1572 domain-containing protein n=1 Tax=Terrimonas ginsenosidimutans TaxID=2908004 RepID=A0ABS9KYC1_9BACT|nr:DUF1572 family protein [Terrimonas ginsenosidimutans]MCG2617296.1 DUF1572 domain-containing protein [Terrimonas ginsenosidimutans]
MGSPGNEYIQATIRRFKQYKELGDKTFVQLDEKDFHFKPGSGSNSIAVIIQHLSGNMLSRFTNFLTEDGEKSWRNRDNEFRENPGTTKEQLLSAWENGWQCLLDTLSSLIEDDLLRTIYIRNEPLLAIDAINRQLAHYPYHIGQITYLGRLIKDGQWQSLSIPPGQSEQYNQSSGLKDPSKKF